MSFGPWTLDPARRQLLRDGVEASLSPKAFDLLKVLAEHHDKAFSTGEQVTLEDLGSRNGTCLRGEKITGRVRLADGDEIRLGPVPVVFRLVSPDSSTSPMESDE